MNEFWLWFWRPIAEFLGEIALLGLFGIVALVWFVVSEWRRKS